MRTAQIGDIWVYNNLWHYLIIDQCAAPYDALFQAIRLEDSDAATINPNHLHDRHLWDMVS